MRIKRTLAILLTLIMVLGMMPFVPISVSAEYEIIEYDIWIAGIRVTSETMANPPAIWNCTIFDPEMNTLDLDIYIRSGNKDDYLYNGAVVYTTMENLNINGMVRTRYGNGVCSTGNLMIDSSFYVECTGVNSPVALTAASLTLDYGVQLVKPEGGEFINGRIATQDGPAKTVKFESGFPFDFDLWVAGTRITSSNYYSIITDLKVLFDKDTSTLYFLENMITSDTYNGSVVYSEMPELTVAFHNDTILRTDAEYGIRTTGALRLKESVGVFANTCAVSAASLSFDNDVSELYPVGCGFSNGAVRDAHGNPAPIVTSYDYQFYDLWLGDVRVEDGNAVNILGDGKARFIPQTNTLTLFGTPDITGTHEGSLIYADGFDLTINGKGTVAGNADYAVRCTGDLTIGGECTFTANVAAILAEGELSIADNYVVESPENGAVENGTVTSSGSIASSVTVASGYIYDLWVGSTRATSVNAADILGDGTVSFHPDTNTLTLSGTPDITGTYEGSLIYADLSSLVISGEGTVAGNADYAIRCTGDLMIDAVCTLTANVAAILAEGNLSLREGSDIAFPVNGAVAGGTVVSSGAYATSVTVNAPDMYDLWLGSTQVTSNNKNDVLNDGGRAVYDPETNTLTLNDPAIEGVAVYRSETCKILCTTDRLTIAGTYDMKREDGCAYGIRFTGDDLYFDGDFTIRSDEAGVRSDGFVTVLSGKLIADGGVCGLVTGKKLKMNENAAFVKMYGCQYGYLFSLTYLFTPFDAAGTLSMTDPVRYSKKAMSKYGNIYCVISDESSGRCTTAIFSSEEPELWVGRTKVTEENASDVLGDESVSYNPETYTLVVHDFSDAEGFHTLGDGTRTRIYAKNMDLTVRGSLHSSLTATTFHEYDVVVENGDLTLDGAFSFRGTEVAVIADKVTIRGGAFQAKGDADTALKTSELRVEKNVTTAGFQGGVTAVDTSAILTYLDYFSCSGEIRNGKIYDDYGNVMRQATIRRAEVFYNLWLGNKQVHEYNKDDIFGDRTARFYPETNTLVLNGSDLSRWELGRNSAWIWYEGFDLTLQGSGKTLVNSYMEGGIHCPDGHSLTIDGYFEFIGTWAGISVHDLTVLSGGVSAIGCDYGILLTGGLYVSENVEYFYACATDEEFPVAVETSGSITMHCTCPQIIPADDALEIHAYWISDDQNEDVFRSFFLPGAAYIDENNEARFNLGLRAGEVYWGTDYHLTVGDRHVTSKNYGDIFGDGKAVFDPDTNTLTLNEPTIDGSDDTTGMSAKISAWDIDLTVTGSYHMSGDAATCGISVEGGSLTLEGDFGFFGTDAAIYAQNGVTLIGTISAVVSGGSFGTTTAVQTQGDVNVRGGTLNAGGGTIGVSCPSGTLTVYAPDTDSVVLEGSEKALYAGGLWFDGNTDEKEFMITSPHGAYFLVGVKTIQVGDTGGYAIIPATHVELRPTSTLGLWVGGRSVNPENCGDIFGNGEASYNPDTHTLTLNDAEYSGAHNGAVIYAGFDLTVTGRAMLTGAEYGILVENGSLTVNGVPTDETGGFITGGSTQINGITCSGSVCGIAAPDGAVTATGRVFVYGETTGILSGRTMTLDGGIAVSSAGCGVSAVGTLTLTGNIDISGGSAAVSAGSVKFSDGYGFVTPEIWSYDPVGRAVLDENGDVAKSVSVRWFERYNLWLGSTEVTGLNHTDIFGDGRASFDPETNVLTLREPTIPGGSNSTLGVGAKILNCGRDLIIRGTYHMTSTDGCSFGVWNEGGRLTFDGFFTFRGTLYGVQSDRHVAVCGELTAIAEGVGISISGETSDGLELVRSFITETTVTAEGGEHAVFVGSAYLLPQDGLDLIEPADGRIEYYTKRIFDGDGAEATRAVLRVDRLAIGKGTQTQPFFIMTEYNWNALAAEIEKGMDTSGLYFALTANINVTSMLGTDTYPFAGIFDGNFLGSGSYTLHLDLDFENEAPVAPFRVIADATVRNLVVDGSVKGAGASGLVGKVAGGVNVIENCDVSASVGTRSLYAAGLILDGGSYATTVAGCTFSGGIYGFTVQTDSGNTGSSNDLVVVIGFEAPGSLSSTLWGGSAAGATVTMTDCLDLASSNYPVGRGDGSVTLTNVYYTAASKAESAQSVWNTVKRAYNVIGVDMTLIKSAGPGVTYGDRIYAAEGETVYFTTNIGDTALAAGDGTLTQNGENAALTMPAMNVSVYRLTSLKYDIHYTETVTGGMVYPSRMRTYAGDIVRIYLDPKTGYVRDEVTVVDAQNAPIALQTDENGRPCFIMPAGEVTITGTFKLKYDYNVETGELRLLCGDFGGMDDRWAEGDALRFMNVTSVTSEPGVRFVGNVSYLFNSFRDCVSFDLHNVDVSCATGIAYMFNGCRSMTSLNIDGWDLSHVTDARHLFDDCRALTSFSFDMLAGAPLADIGGMFSNCSSLAFVDLTALDRDDLPDMSGIFSGCPNLHEITLAPGMSVTSDMSLNNNGSGWVAEGTTVILCDGSENGTFTAPGAETTYRWATDVYGPRYAFDEDTGVLTLRWGTFNPFETVWEQLRNENYAVTGVTAEPGVRFVGELTEMFGSFRDCVSIDLSNVDVSGATGLRRAFAGCASLTSVDLSVFDPASLSDMTGIFSGCPALHEVTLAPGMSVTADMELNNNGWGWVAEGTTAVLCGGEDHGTFAASSAKTTYKWATDVLGPRYIFDETTGALTLCWGAFNPLDALWTEILNNKAAVLSVTANRRASFVGDCYGMFALFSNCVSIDLSDADVSGMTVMGNMFGSCSALTRLDLANWDTARVTDAAYAFQYCTALTQLDLSGWDTRRVGNMSGMFIGCEALPTLDLSHFDTSSVEYFDDMFSGCSSLTTLNLAGWNTSAATSTFNMFGDCSSLTALDLSHFDTSNVEFMNFMFAYCSSLTALDLSSFDTSKVIEMSGMFSGCTSLTALDLSHFDTSNVEFMSNMFSDCSGLRVLDLSGFTLVRYYDDWMEEYCDPDCCELFNGCTSLKEIVLPAGFAVTEEMCLQNGDANDPGWVVQGDGTLTVVSGTDEYAVIAAQAAVTTFVLKTALAAEQARYDLNGDGDVTVADVSALLDHIASVLIYDAKYDLNDDGEVAVADVTYLLDYLATMH